MWRRLRLVVAVVGLVGLGASVAFASNTFTDVDEGRYYTDAVHVHKFGTTYRWQHTFHRAMLNYRDASDGTFWIGFDQLIADVNGQVVFLGHDGPGSQQEPRTLKPLGVLHGALERPDGHHGHP